jgi:hypothetical protein
MNEARAELDRIHSQPDLWASFVRSGYHSVRETGELPSGPDHPLWSEIERLHDEHPARFDSYHPCLAKLFHFEHKHHHPGVPVIPPAMPPGGGVPEPSSFILLIIPLLGWLLFRHLRFSPDV